MKMLRKIYLWLLLAAVLALGGACLLLTQGEKQIDETVNLIDNGGFEQVSDDLPADWTPGKWFGDEGVSYLELSREAYEGDYCILVENVEENDARFEQTVSVEPNALYRFTCMVKAENCGAGSNGASISIKDTFAYSDMLYDTAGEWQEVVFYGRTGANQKSLTVMLRVGGYGRLNTGKAWFDNLQMTRLRELPGGAQATSLATNPPKKAESTAVDARSSHTALIVLIGLAFAALCLWVFPRMQEDERLGKRWVVFACLAGAALVIRLILAGNVRGYPNDMSCFLSWSDRMFRLGPLHFYSDSAFCDYPPGYMLLLWPIGALRALFGLTGDNSGAWLMVKLMPIACDLLGGYAVYRLGKKRLGERAAALLGLTYLLNPAVILDSAMWGQIDSVLTLVLVLALLQAMRGDWLRAMLIYTAGVLIKPQALLLAPIGLMMALWEIVRAKNKARMALRVGTSLAAAVGAMLLFALPFAVGAGENLIGFLIDRYSASMGNYNYITINAANLYVLLDMNWKALSESGVWQYVAWGMLALAYVYAMFLYIKGGDKKKIFLVCAVLLSLLFAFGAKMHERYVFPALLLMLMAYVLERDVRLLAVFAACSFSVFVNAALVLQDQHLVAQYRVINLIVSAVTLINALTLAWTGWDLCVRHHAYTLQQFTDRGTKVYHKSPRYAMRLVLLREDAYLHMRRSDYAILAAITLIYAALAFTNLGDLKAPQSSWNATMAGEEVVFDLGEEQTFHLTYYGGICNSSFDVSISNDGENWSEPQSAIYDQGEIFKWHWYVPAELSEQGNWVKLENDYPLLSARYVRLTAQKAGLVLSEVGFLNAEGEALKAAQVMSMGGAPGRESDPYLLTDEQDTVPAYPTYLNGMYFDEIYHARTGYEFAHGMTPYETTHPPLGKVLIMLGIRLFGMTPFGWRFMGALFGVLMLPVMYLLIKQLLKKTEYAAAGTFLLAVDAMHFTQTRIATIDTYGVFFILLMYLFMFRYLQMNFFFDDFRKTLVPLGLSGVAMGLGIASKWICIYAGAGLAVLFFYSLIRRYLEYRQAMRSGGSTRAEITARKYFWRYFVLTGLFCIVFFILVPLLIYYFSYYWYMKPLGGLSVSGVWQRQLNMFNYHSGLSNDTHFFRSPWYEWPFIVRPMWYFSGTQFMPAGVISSISCMGNPAVWWGGLAALIFVVVQLLRGKGDRTCVYLVISFAAQYLPWVLVPRSMFIYHYFASVPFIIVCMTVVMRRLRQRHFRWYKPCLFVFLAAALALFIAFYPLESGYPAARSYAQYLRWFNWYNF